MIHRILDLLAVAAAGLILAGPRAHAATPRILQYDADTLLPAVPSPGLFWRSNFVDGAEITFSISGGRVTPALAASITRDTELTAAIAALSSVYQPLDADLTDLADGNLDGSKVGPGISGDNVTTGTIADGRIAATIARLASPALTGAPTVPTASANSSNSVAASTAYVDRAVALGVGAGGGGDAYLGNSQVFTGPTNEFTGTLLASNLATGTLRAQAMILDEPIGVPALGTNLADAQAELQLTPGQYTQPYSLRLLQLAAINWANGTMAYHDGTVVTGIVSTATGRLLLAAADAAAARAAIAAPTWPSDAGYDAGAWDGDTNAPTKNAVRDALEALAGSTNALITSVDANSFSTPGGKLTFNTNANLPRWIGTTLQAGTNDLLTYGTNVVVADYLISSNDVPAIDGRYLTGTADFFLTNASGSSINFHLNALLNGTVVFRDQISFASGANITPISLNYRLVRASSTTGHFVATGGRFASGYASDAGIGEAVSASGIVQFATNAAVNWSSNVAFQYVVTIHNLGGTANSNNVGVARLGSSMYRP